MKQNETHTHKHTKKHKKNANTNKIYTKTHNRTHTMKEILGFISWRIFRISLVCAVILHTQTQKPHTNTQKTTHTHTHVLSVNINLQSVRSAMCQPTIQFTVSRSPLQHSVAERKIQQTAVFGSVRFVRTSKGN